MERIDYGAFFSSFSERKLTNRRGALLFPTVYI
jgi:hypothetical protein